MVGEMRASVGSVAGAESKWASVVVLFSASSSAAVIRRRRRIGDSIDVLTIHSCRAVRLSIRERCSTSEESAVRPQEVVGRACAASSRLVKCRI